MSVYRPISRAFFRVLAVAASVLSLTTCRPKPQDQRVEAVYDKQTGKLSQLTVDARKDGKPNIFSYMDGTKFLRIEIDKDEDGRIDRWEYYADDRQLQKVGLSRANDGKQDSWVYQGPDGSVARIEISTKRNGKVDRTEFYLKGELSRAEVDTDGDGRIDKWEEYASGALIRVSFDTTKSGKPNTSIDYRK
ncbi:MAG TPA: hypothetical protein VJM31_18535 [Vicinamibacterales bacterium]|nr:hypothetical protein [Vicinamibacterales bacterium]